MITGWFVTVRAQAAAVATDWRILRGGWQAISTDTPALFLHRRILVETPALVAGESKIVLRTRLRLQGDTQTDIAGSWLRQALPGEIQEAMETHGHCLAGALAGFAAALSLERLVLRLLALVATLVSIVGVVKATLGMPPRLWLAALLGHWWLWFGILAALLGVAARLCFRWWLRRWFRRGLGVTT